MQFEKFEAHDMREALAAIKAALGPDAVIIATRQLPRRGLFWRPRLEVTAARGENALPAESNPPQSSQSPNYGQRRSSDTKQVQRRYALASEEMDEAPPPQRAWERSSPVQGLSFSQELEQRLSPLEQELRQVRAVLQQTRTQKEALEAQADLTHSEGLQASSLSKHVTDEFGRMRRILAAMSLGGSTLGEFRRHADRAILEAADVDDEVATSLLDELRRAGPEPTHAPQVATRLRLVLAQAIPTLGDFFAHKKRRRIALLGPTGVGKTTTVAKIAAHAALKHGMKVALISLDTYRIGASEQIGHYGRLVGVPVTVAHDRASFIAALETYAAHDLVLIDTAGRGPDQAAAHCLQLRQLFLGQHIEVYLTLAAATRRLERQQMLKAMGELHGLGARAIILTKTDEAVALGSCISLTHRTGLPLAFVTCGQKVPEDLACADANVLAARLVERILAHRESILHEQQGSHHPASLGNGHALGFGPQAVL